MSWRDFFFGAFDPAGTVTTASCRVRSGCRPVRPAVRGAHLGVVSPQVIEGALTILLLYHAMRRLARPVAGLLAAGILAISPAAVSLNLWQRPGHADDLARGAGRRRHGDRGAHRAVARRRCWRACGSGLAFQAKMMEAWLMLPALASCYLLAARVRWCQRSCVLLRWASWPRPCLSLDDVLTLSPALLRPYVDGSRTTASSRWSSLQRLRQLDQVSPDQLLYRSIQLGLPKSPPPSWHRLLSGAWAVTAPGYWRR